MRRGFLGILVVALTCFGLGIGWAAEGDETIITVEVSSADHEVEEGYFALGEDVTVMAKPGSDLHRFLTRQRGQKVKIVLSKAETRELSRIRR